MLFEKALQTYEKETLITKSAGTYKFTKGKSKTLYDFFGKMECNDISKLEILDFILFLRERNPNISNASINKYVGLLQRTLKSICEITLNFSKLKEEKKLIKVILNDIINQVFEYLDNSLYPEHLRNLVMFKLLLDTGLRISELLSLKINDIDFEKQTINVKHTKTKTQRLVFFTLNTQDYVMKYIIQCKIKDYLFINLTTREIMKPDRVQKICQNIKRQIGTNFSITPHKWRHTFATNFTNKNGNLEMLRIIMGHTTITTTQRYLHVDSERLRIEYKRVQSIPHIRA